MKASICPSGEIAGFESFDEPAVSAGYTQWHFRLARSPDPGFAPAIGYRPG
jgi:hypothetical protein